MTIGSLLLQDFLEMIVHLLSGVRWHRLNEKRAQWSRYGSIWVDPSGNRRALETLCSPDFRSRSLSSLCTWFDNANQPPNFTPSFSIAPAVKRRQWKIKSSINGGFTGKLSYKWGISSCCVWLLGVSSLKVIWQLPCWFNIDSNLGWLDLRCLQFESTHLELLMFQIHRFRFLCLGKLINNFKYTGQPHQIVVRCCKQMKLIRFPMHCPIRKLA